MKYVILILKGFLFGIANLIPGVSGGTMAVITGVYEDFLESINHFFQDFRRSVSFLLPYGVGIITAILLGSRLIAKCIEVAPIPTMSLFIGFIAGGVPVLYRPIQKNFQIKNICIFLGAVTLVLIFLFLPTADKSATDLQPYEYILLLASGFLASVAMVLPGISGMMIFMLFGYYQTLMNALSGLLKASTLWHSLTILIPIAIGVLLGLFTACRIFSHLLKKYPKQSYFAILGFVIASMICVFYKMLAYEFQIVQGIVGLIMVLLGFCITYYLSKLNQRKGQALPTVDKE